jgi:hypothetical protein
MMVPPSALIIASHVWVVGRHVSVVLHRRFETTMYKTQKGCTGKNAGPSYGFMASPRVGPRVTVGALKTGYPRIQAPSQDGRKDGCAYPCDPWHQPPPLDSGELRSHLLPHGPGSRLLAQGSSRAATCLMAPARATGYQGSYETAMCPLGYSSRLQA